MKELIKKVLASRQTKRVQKRRLEDNRYQLKLIYRGLIEKGF